MAAFSLDEAAQLYSTLRHFFEVAVHDILYYRRLYPERAFAAATAFDVPVHQSRHPAVCAWVRAAVEQVIVQIAGGDDNRGISDRPGSEDGLPADNVNAVAVAVHAPFETKAGSAQAHSLPPGAVLEKWVFDVRHLPRGWPGGIEALRRAQKDIETREQQDEERARERRQRRRRQRSPKKEAENSAVKGQEGHEGQEDLEGQEGQEDQEGQEGQGGHESQVGQEDQENQGDLDDQDDQDYQGDQGDQDVQDVQGGGRYDYYDEEEELANAESEAELDDSPSASDNEDDENNGDGDQGDDSSTTNWKDLHEQLRGVLQRLAQAGQQVAALPDGCTFTMAIELGDGDNAGGGAKTRHMDSNWIPEATSRKRQFGGGLSGGAGALTRSIRSVDSAPLFLECWVEESAVKKAAADGASSAKLAITAKTARDVLPPPPTASASTETSYGMNTSFNFDQFIAQDSFAKDKKPPQNNKAKNVSFS
ncbi:hypothetical protein Sste5346_009306 [Sporothrix stenoceras]|uniref:HORMA domain-containing protein n=1 Tax=Sporothrix stenoceras TaxID=5173 RepID=A0ABR3YKW1_9PEZI